MSFLRAVAWVILIIIGMLVIVVYARAEAYVFEGKAGGTTESFFVSRGDYELSLVAERPQDWLCRFSGSFDRATPAYSISLGNAITVDQDDWKPWAVDHFETLAAGEYTLQVSPQTTCNWTFHLVPRTPEQSQSAANSKPFGKERPCCIEGVTMFRNPMGRPVKSTTASVKDLVLLAAPYISKPGYNEIGMGEIRIGGTTLKEDVLQSHRDGRHRVFYLYVQWSDIGVRDRGKITVHFHTPMGDSVGKFTITK